MHLRLRLAAIGSAVALAAGLGLVFAGPALATDGVRLCFDVPASDGGGIACLLLDSDSDGSLIANPDVASEGGTYWDSPTSGTAQISYPGGLKVCMEIDADLNDDVRVNPCDALASEEWSVITSDATVGNETVTSYFYKSSYGSDLCLTAANSAHYDVYATTCDYSSTWQNFFFYNEDTGTYS